MKYEVSRSLNRDGVSCFCKVNNGKIIIIKIIKISYRNRGNSVLLYYIAKLLGMKILGNGGKRDIYFLIFEFYFLFPVVR